MTGTGLNISVSLELDPSLAPALTSEPAHTEGLRDSLREAVDDLVTLLGIPGDVQISVDTEATRTPEGPLVRVSANGHLCRYSNELVLWVHHYARGIQTGVESRLDAVTRWLQDPQTAPEQAVEFFTLLCVEILKNEPAQLLHTASAAAYLASLPPGDPRSARFTRADADAYLPVLTTLLELRISLADTEQVAKVLSESAGRSQADLAERLITSMRRDVVEIQIDRAYLKQITNTDPENALGMFPFLREGLFDEAGLEYPAFRFTPVEHLKAHAFSFKVNDLTTAPILGLSPGQRLVNETADGMKSRAVEAIDSLNPASAQTGSLIPNDTPRAALETLTTWGDLEYLVLSLADALRKTAGCFVQLPLVENMVTQLQVIAGALVTETTARLPLEQIARILRALAVEGVSIRNARTIFEALLDYAMACESAGKPVEDAEAVAGVRASLRRQIEHKYRRGTEIDAYLLDRRIEQILARGALAVTDTEREQICAAVGQELAGVARTASIPLLFTWSAGRALLRDIVRRQFPRLVVVSYEDLPPQTNVRPVGRIELGREPEGDGQASEGAARQ